MPLAATVALLIIIAPLAPTVPDIVVTAFTINPVAPELMFKIPALFVPVNVVSPALRFNVPVLLTPEIVRSPVPALVTVPVPVIPPDRVLGAELAKERSAPFCTIAPA